VEVFSIKDRLCGLVVSSWLQIQRSGFDSLRYQIFWEAVGLERGPLSLVSATEELFERKVAAPIQKTEITAVGDPLRWPHDTFYPQNLALTWPTSGGRSVGIVRSRTRATEFVSLFSIKMADISNIWRIFPLREHVIALCRHCSKATRNLRPKIW
jgi:hypothetical protein